MDQGELLPSNRKKPNLKPDERRKIISMLLDYRNNHGGIYILADGSLSVVANFSTGTVLRYNESGKLLKKTKKIHEFQHTHPNLR